VAVEQATRQQIIDQASDLAFRYEQAYGSCSQCVLRAMQEVFGLISDDTLKAGYGLAGGGGATGRGTCGALAAGMMAVSARYGRDKSQMDQGLPFRPFALAREVMDRFVAVYGSPICADVQRSVFGRCYDFYSKDDYEAFEKAGGHIDKCPGVAGNAARFAAEVLMEAEEQDRAKST